jgi:hypothetical protein
MGTIHVPGAIPGTLTARPTGIFAACSRATAMNAALEKGATS